MVEPRETLGALWLCAAFTSTASGGIPVSRCTRSRTAAVMSAPAKTRSTAMIAIGVFPSSSTSACPISGSRIPAARPVRAAQQPCGRPEGGVTSTRATPALRLMNGPFSLLDDQLVVGLRTPLLERKPWVRARPFDWLRIELNGDPAVGGPGLGVREHRPIGGEDVGAADVSAVPVEPDHVGKDGVDAVVAGEDVVKSRRGRLRLEELLLRGFDLRVAELSRPPV